MTNRARVVPNKDQGDPYPGSSLLPMLVAGLAFILVGMVAAVMFS